jgi:glutamine amidotransferase PdxT
MLKGNIKGRKADSFEFNEKEKAAFKLLKASFIRAPMLIHFKSNRQIRVETNISNFAITEVLL